MKKLINISDQQFYSTKIYQIVESCSQKENCAIIIDENYLEEFVKVGGEIIGNQVNQIIIISETLNAAFSLLEGVSVFIVAANNLEEAVCIAILGEALSKEIICVQIEDEQKVMEIMKEKVT